MGTKEQWLYGLGSAFIGGCAGAIDSGIALIIIAPETFNLSTGLRKTLITVLVLGLLTGAKTAAAFLKQSPLPREPWTDAQRDLAQVTGQSPPTAAKAENVLVVKVPPNV